MSYYANPRIPEDLSSSNEKHLRSFLKTGLKILGVIAAFLLILDIGTRVLAPLLPFSWERKLTPESLVRTLAEAEGGPPALELELNKLGQRLAANMDLPPDMELTFHYSPGSTVNAFATLGGNIIVFQGLIDQMESEDALAAVLAHEIAHIKHRDMIKGLMRAAGLIVVSTALGSADSSSGLSQGAMQLGVLSYSRGQESSADVAATVALGRVYGHSQGFEDCFTALIKAAGGRDLPEILSSHPDSRKRIEKSQKTAAKYGFPATGPTRPLAPAFLAAKSKAKAEDKSQDGTAAEP